MQILLLLVIATFAICDGTKRACTYGNVNGTEVIAQSTQGFNNVFLKALAKDNPGNLIASSFSAQVALATAAYGARGITVQQMRSVLGIPENDQLGQSGYRSIIEIFNSQTSVNLSVADKMYTAKQFNVKPAYQRILTDYFLSSSEALDFVNDAQGSAAIINAWCANATNNTITQVVTADDLPPATLLVLVNAVYFKGEWDQQFDPNLTKPLPFYPDNQTTVDVPTMFIHTKLQYLTLDAVNASCIMIPYKNNEFYMLIALPNEVDGLQTILNNLDKINVTEIASQAVLTDTNLYFPKFNLESSLDLQPPLTKIGMGNMFENSANFSGITDTQPLKIGKVIQKAIIEVDEEGSVAAAVTVVVGITLTALGPPGPLEFQVNRPFLYYIVHNPTGIALFAGCVYNPSLA